MKKITDSRPFVRSSVDKGDYFEVSRENVTTGKLYIVKVDKWVYLAFIKGQRSDVAGLQMAGFNKEQILFLTKNLIPDENRKRFKTAI